MAQAIGESIFDIWYLCTAVVVGMKMISASGNTVVKTAGYMTVLLGAGDAFHLVPRMWALWTTGLRANAGLLGFGKLVTSVTMTVFYILLYRVWCGYYKTEKKSVTYILYTLAAVRVALCFLPRNKWLSVDPPLYMGILRNIPFLFMGIIIIVLFCTTNKTDDSKVFRFMPLAIALSFGLYIPVVLFSAVFPMIGMLMIPKTLAYVWVVFMCRKLQENI